MKCIHFIILIILSIIFHINCEKEVSNGDKADQKENPQNDENIVSDESDKRLIEFSTWILDNEVEFVRPVEITSSKAYGNHFVASDSIPPKLGKLVSIPEKIVINTQKIYNSEIGQILKDNDSSIQGRSSLAVFLLYEWNKGNSSFWFPYLNLVNETIRSSSVIFWSEKEQELLKGSWILDRIYEDLISLQADFDRVFTEKLFKKYPEIFSEEDYTFENYMWAWTIIWSRSFHFENTDSALVPVADLFNHKNEAKSDVEYNEKESKFEFIIRDTYKKGEQIFNNYSPRPNNELLRLYGFILPKNNENVAFLETGLDEDDPNFGLKEEILNSHDLWSFPYPYSNIPNGLFITQKGIPIHVMAYLRVKFWKPSEFQKKAFQKDGTIPKINPNSQLSSENEKAVLSYIMDLCVEHINRYPESYKEDQQLLKDKSLDFRTQIAIITRLEEKNIYNKVRNWILGLDHRAKSEQDIL